MFYKTKSGLLFDGEVDSDDDVEQLQIIFLHRGTQHVMRHLADVSCFIK